MKSLALTSEGIEEISALEIKELIKADSSISRTCIEFEAKDFKDLFRICYSSQSISRLILLLNKFKIKKDFFSELKIAIQSTKFEDWITKETKVAFRSHRYGMHDFTTVDIEKNASAYFFEKNHCEVDLDNPEITFIVYVIDSSCYIGIDFSADLSKRDYKIFSNIRSLRPEIAYSLVRLSGFTKDSTLIDPFSGSGEVAIEACLYACRFSPHFYSKDKFPFIKIPKFRDFDFEEFFENIDKDQNLKKTNIYSYDNQLKNVSAAKKNAKIAGINKFLSMSRVDIDWLETKFKESAVDQIAARIPDIPKHQDQFAIRKVLDEFLYQAAFILKPKGKIITISRHNKTLKEKAKKYKFKITDEKEVWQGKDKLIISQLIKS